jgi:hypothetical protein
MREKKPPPDRRREDLERDADLDDLAGLLERPRVTRSRGSARRSPLLRDLLEPSKEGSIRVRDFFLSAISWDYAFHSSDLSCGGL